MIENGFNAELLRPIFEGETETSNTITDAQFGSYQVDPEVKAIAKGFCSGFDQRKLAIGSLYLENPDVLFVATNDDPYYVSGKSRRLYPDVGASLSALEAATSRKAFRVGKPSNFGF